MDVSVGIYDLHTVSISDNQVGMAHGKEYQKNMLKYI